MVVDVWSLSDRAAGVPAQPKDEDSFSSFQLLHPLTTLENVLLPAMFAGSMGKTAAGTRACKCGRR